MDETKLLQRLEELATRVERIELQIGLRSLIDARNEQRAARAENDVSTKPVAPTAPVHVIPMPPPLPVISVEPPPSVASENGVAHESVGPSIPTPVLPYVPRQEAKTFPPFRANDGSFERAIGLKWAGWIGAIVLVIGAGFAIKFAYDNGWFGVFPPEARLALMSLGGFALIGAGEWVRRRVNVISAAGLFGAGVATLFLVSYAGYDFYKLYDRDVAFVMMGFSTLIGAAVAMRGKLVSIAVLSIIGGNIAPIVLRGDETHLVPFLSYLLMLQIVALFLSWWGGREKWWVLRGVSLATTFVWGATLLLTPKQVDVFGPMLWFMLLYAALYQIELIASALRRGNANVSKAATEPAAVVSLLVTALLTAAVLYLFRDATHLTRGLWVMALAAACSTVGFALRRPNRPRLAPLSDGFRIQAAALIVVAVPVALSGVWIILGWTGLALAFAVLGFARDLEISRHAAVATWLLAIGKLILWAQYPGNPGRATWWTLWETNVPAYALLAWMMAIVGHGIAMLVSNSKSRRLDGAMHMLASVTWVAAAMIALPPLGATFAIVVYAWLLVALEMATRRAVFLSHAMAVLVLATVKWAVVDMLAARLSPGWSPMTYAPVVNPMTALGALIGASLAGIYWLRRDVLPAWLRRDGQGSEPFALGVILIGIATLALSLEIDRVVERAALTRAILWPAWQLKQLAWTMLWTAATAALAGLVIWLTPDPSRREHRLRDPVSIGILLACKFLFVDSLTACLMHGATPAFPIGNFQTFTALILFGALLGARRMCTGPRASSLPLIGCLALLVILTAGTLDVDRTFERLARAGSTLFTDPRLAKQVALSIFWALFATALIVTGFRNRSAGARYFALTLFAVTLTKVMTVDLAHAGSAYRIVSFVGLGALLLGTSVLYGKLGPKLAQGK